MTFYRSAILQLAAAAFLLSPVLQADAQDNYAPLAKPADSIFSMNGVGTHSCGVYMENRRGLNSETYKHMYQQWGAGFMAGASKDGGGANPVTDLETYTAWLDKWCADDPASKIISGYFALGKRLSTQK